MHGKQVFLAVLLKCSTQSIVHAVDVLLVHLCLNLEVTEIVDDPDLLPG